MTPDEMKKRLKAYALRCIRLAESFPRTMTGKIVAGQLIRAATSAAANYRASCLARSRADFIAKMGIVEEETDESLFWIEVAVDAGLVKESRVTSLAGEGTEILRIVISSRKTAKARS
jgi:four helix bundle protein